MAGLAVSVLLPVALLAWLAAWPAGSITGYALQALGIGAVLLGLALVGLWTVPPWWVAWLWLGLWAATVLAHGLFGPSGLPLRPEGWGWLGVVLGLALTFAGTWASVAALAARRPPPGPVVDLAMPLGPGRYLVALGGSRSLLNGHMKTLRTDVPRFADWRGQSHAVDIVGRGPLGLHADGLRPVDPGRYAIFGAPVRAPCAGEVIRAVDGLLDMPVPEMDRDHMAGNHVLLRCEAADILLAHLRRGSVAVAVGDRVEAGAPIGEVGNSGNSSEPHLHVHAQRPGPEGRPFAGDPLPLRIDGRYLVRNARLDVSG